MNKTIELLKNATFAIEIPNEKCGGLTVPTGTGFFVSNDGFFVTAAHVVATVEDFSKINLVKETPGVLAPPIMCEFLELIYINIVTDIAILKVDFQKNSQKEWLKHQTGFPFLLISTRKLDDGESVFSFGYPLSGFQLQQNNTQGAMGFSELSPRLTSAIISSSIEKTKQITTGADLQIYVLDKALNYGNSGGPIISAITGRVHAYCSRFQPVNVTQLHLNDANGQPINITIPSLYGIVTSFDNKLTLNELVKNAVEIKND
jgi:serine protease Do